MSALKKTLTVLLIEDSPDYAALVQQWLSLKTDVAFVLHWTDSLQPGLNRLKKGGVDAVLLDLSLPDSSGLETFARTKLQASSVPVILLTGDNSEQLGLQLVRDGAQDYIVKGSCNGQSLAKAIQYAVVRKASREADTGAGVVEDPGSIIAVMGVKGGVGATTIACNLAVELQHQTDQKTLLADLDLNGGMVGFLMSTESEYSVLDAAANADCLDPPYWRSLVAQSPDGPEVLRSPGLAGAAEPAFDDLEHVLAAVRRLYRWAVVDLGRPSKFSLSLLNQATELFLVTTTAIPALYEATRAIEGLREAGFEASRLRMIVNQLSGRKDVPEKELDRLFGVPIYATFPAADQDLHEAYLQNRLPAKNSTFRLRTASLARQMAGLRPEKPKSIVSQIFSFSDRSSTAQNHVTTAGGL
jgi:Flp pilus assembly CpaE family ATPase